MTSPLTQQVTAILERLDAGEAKAAEELLPLVYTELRSAAGRLSEANRPTTRFNRRYWCTKPICVW